MTIGQIWYGWSARGAEGVNQEQIIAASGLLADRSRALTRLLLTVCYAPELPAFGWLELQGVRVVFRRRPTGMDGRGRPGNFFVHALAAGRDALPLSLLGGLWQARVWVDEAPADPPEALTALDSSDDLGLVPEPAVDDQTARLALAGVVRNLAVGQRSAIDIDERAAVAIASVLVRSLPDRFGLMGFSTCETENRAALYDLVAGPPIAQGFSAVFGGTAPDRASHLAAALLLDDSPTAAGIVEALSGRAASLQGFVRGLCHWMTLEQPRSISVARQVDSDAEVLAFVASDLRLVARFSAADGGLQRVAQGVVHQLPVAVDLVRGLAEHRGTDLVAAIVAAAPSVRPDAFVAALETLAASDRALAVATGERVVQQWLATGDITELGTCGGVALVRLLGTNETARRLVEALLRDPVMAGALFADSAVRLDFQVAAVRRHARDIPGEAIVRALVERPGFAADLFGGDISDGLVSAISGGIARSSIDVARAAAAIAARLVEVRIGVLWCDEVLRRLVDPRQRYSWCVLALRLTGAQNGRWTHVALDGYVATIRDQAQTSSRLTVLDGVVAESGRDDRTLAWRAVRHASMHPSFEIAEVHVHSLAEGSEQDAAVELIFDAAMRLSRDYEHWASVVRRLRIGFGLPSQLAVAAAARAVRRTSGVEAAINASWVIQWAVAQIGEGVLDSNELKKSLADQLGATLAHSPDWHRWLEARTIDQPVAVKRWLRRVGRAADAVR